MAHVTNLGGWLNSVSGERRNFRLAKVAKHFANQVSKPELAKPFSLRQSGRKSKSTSSVCLRQARLKHVKVFFFFTLRRAVVSCKRHLKRAVIVLRDSVAVCMSFEPEDEEGWNALPIMSDDEKDSLEGNIGPLQSVSSYYKYAIEDSGQVLTISTQPEKV